MNKWDDIKNDVIIQPIIWREPTDHDRDCYFCACDITGLNKKREKIFVYPNVQSVTPAKKGKIDKSDKTVADPPEIEHKNASEVEQSSGSDYEDSSSSKNPILFDQDDLDDLIRDLNLPKDSAELLASKLKERNLLLPETKVTVYRKREQEFVKYFTSENSLVYCHDIEGLINVYKKDLYNADDWRLFIDSSKENLKAVLLHNGNKYAAIPIGHSTVLKESYESFQILLEKIKYNSHKWLICGDFKMINLLVGLQSGNTKYPCFLCLWDSRARDEHWSGQKDWSG